MSPGTEDLDRRAKVVATNAPATTTAEEDRAAQGARNSQTAAQGDAERKAQGQRDINLIWETTQKHIAQAVVGSSLFVSVSLSVFSKPLKVSENVQLAAIVFLFGVANLVTGFYFGRTNHTKTGGVGGNVAGER